MDPTNNTLKIFSKLSHFHLFGLGEDRGMEASAEMVTPFMALSKMRNVLGRVVDGRNAHWPYGTGASEVTVLDLEGHIDTTSLSDYIRGVEALEHFRYQFSAPIAWGDENRTYRAYGGYLNGLKWGPRANNDADENGSYEDNSDKDDPGKPRWEPRAITESLDYVIFPNDEPLGSAGLVYGYLLVWIGTIAVFTTMAELAFMAPTAGGQYHWVCMLAPPSCRKFLSYIMGWLVICGWQAILAGGGYLGGTMIVALIQLNHDDYVPELWHGTLLFWAIIVVAVFTNTVTSSILLKIEIFILAVHVVGFFAVLIPVVHLAPDKVSAHDVFTQFSNGGAWPSQRLSFFICLIGNVYAMFGCDSAVHMAEEIKNAEVVVPVSMLTTTVLNGALGFAIVIAVLFLTTDITAALASPTGVLDYPFMQIFYDATGSKAGASVPIAIMIIMDVAGTIALVATASRLVWAFARDRGLPGWRSVSKVQSKTAIPFLAVIITSLIACLIGLVGVGSSTAFNDVISLGVSSLYASYIITESLLLWRRCTSAIRKATDVANDTGEANQLVWGPFRLPGIFDIIVNAWAVVFGIIIFFFGFWPVATPVTAAHMNFRVLMTGSVVLFAVLYYVLWARKTYKGLIVEVTPFSTVE